MSYGINALGALDVPEGVPIQGRYYFRASTVVPPVAGGFAAGVGGAGIARFGWSGADGRVTNARASEHEVQGLVVWQPGDWRRIYWDDATQSWRIREGMNLTLLAAAPGVWVYFPNGASINARVYTSPLDGIPVAGYAEGLEITPWVVARPIGPGGLSFITTWNPRQ